MKWPNPDCRFRRNDGAVALEVAIILPIFLLLVMGILEVGLILFLRSAVEIAMSDGIRLTSIAADRNAYIRSEVRRLSRGIIDSNQLNITATTYALPPGGAAVVYRVTYSWHVITPLLGNVIGNARGDFPIVATAMTRNRS